MGSHQEIASALEFPEFSYQKKKKKKIESIVLSSRHKVSVVDSLSIFCNNVGIKGSKTVKYLGIYLDQSRIKSAFRKQYFLTINE